MKKYLRCHTESDNSPITIGKNYEIRKEYVDDDGDLCYEIRTDEGRLEDFTAYPDKDGDSYLNWFTIETDEEPRKIDGRKAEITNAGQRYDMYTEFAVKHGYPDAVRNKWNRDSRAEPKDGDIVTLLESGEHEYGWDTLWIVETADGERHIIGEKGLRILSEELSGVTVLKDDSLSGIEREYREVKRKANVGERIKIVKRWPLEDRYVIGDVFVTSSVRQSDGYVRVDSLGERVIALEEYVVLEPTDIIRIDDPDGVNRGYRMVDRKAAVGERVIAVSTAHTEIDGTTVLHEIGEVGSVTAYGMTYQNRVRINGYYVVDGDYRVLEPVESAKTAAPNAQILSAQPPLDQAAATISALTAKMQALESRVDTLEKARQPIKVAEGPADDAPPSFADMPRAKSLQQIRDEIVERAKADVKRLAIGRDVDFVVNREKRAVVALICGTISGRILSRGIAKCAPNDVFNAHIGRAIALRRALGLEVPAEYLSVPNPEEPRVGDVVAGGRPDTFYSPDKRFTLTADRGDGSFKYAERPTDWIESGQIGAIIDDSREEVGA